MGRARREDLNVDLAFEEWEDDDTFDDVGATTERMPLPPRRVAPEELREALEWEWDDESTTIPGDRSGPDDDTADTFRQPRAEAVPPGATSPSVHEADTRILDVGELAGILEDEVEAALRSGHQHIPSSELVGPSSDIHDRVTPIQPMPEYEVDIEVDFDPDSEG